VIDHVCYTISNWDEGKVRGALKAKGFDAHWARRQPACLRSVRLRRPVRQRGQKRVPARRIRNHGKLCNQARRACQGKISRRALLETLTVAATTTAAATASAAPASDPALKINW
jgi:hypothetical protein